MCGAKPAPILRKRVRSGVPAFPESPGRQTGSSRMQRLGWGVLEAHRPWDEQDRCLGEGGQKPPSEPSPQPSRIGDCGAQAHQERHGCVQPVPAPQEASRLRPCPQAGRRRVSGNPRLALDVAGIRPQTRVCPSLRRPLGGLCPLPLKSRGDSHPRGPRKNRG